MIHGMNDRTIGLLVPQSVAASSTAAGTVDTLGYDYAIVKTHLGTAATNPTELVLGDGSATNSFTDITAAVGDTAWTIPAADTANAQIIQFCVNLTYRARYLQLEVSPGATQLMSAMISLQRADETPTANSGQAAAGTGLTANVVF